MRSEKFYTSIGIFVVGALILFITGSVFLYQEYTHSRVQMYAMFFKGSLQGLNATTPVTYRGIRIGEVKLIEVTVNADNNDVMIPVYVEFFVEKNYHFIRNPIHILISNGYIAQISKPDFITNNAKIELVQNKTPVTPNLARFHGYPVFPTKQTIKQYTTLDDALKSAKKTFEAIRQLVESREISDLLLSTRDMTKNLDMLAINADKYLPQTIIHFSQTLNKIADAASSTQNLADYLSRNPESLLRGKR